MFTKLLLNSIKLNLHQRNDISTEVAEKNNAENGFSLVEVLVSIFILSGFFLGSLQATVYATLIRVQAQDKQETTNWIQQDVEQIRYQAFMLDTNNDLYCNTNYSTNAPCDTLASEFGSVPTVSSSTDACDQSRYGERLQEFIDETYLVNSTVAIDNKPYEVTRTYTYTTTGTTADNILQITYNVDYANTHPRYKGVGANNTVSSLSTEVLPNASLSCS